MLNWLPRIGRKAHSEPAIIDNPEFAAPAELRPRPSLGKRLVDLAIITAALVALLAVIAAAHRVFTGTVRTHDDSALPLRLSLANGSGFPGAGFQIARNLNGYVDGQLHIAVVDTTEFTVSRVPTSFVIARLADDRPARRLAARLGLGESVIVRRPLDHNDRLIGATLVIGEDYHLLNAALAAPGKE